MANKKTESAINNIEINKEGNYILISINPKIYPMEIIYCAAYVFLDRAYVLIDGNPEEEVFVELKPKGDVDLKTLGMEFNNELLNYEVYTIQAARTQQVRDALVERVFLTNTAVNSDVEKCYPEKDEEFQELQYEEDPLGIAKPWNQKSKKTD